MTPQGVFPFRMTGAPYRLAVPAVTSQSVPVNDRAGYQECPPALRGYTPAGI